MMKDYSFDMHIHSCLSPCAEDTSTPDVMAGLFALSGFDIIALTDHNSCGNCEAFLNACEHYGILGIPGMELNTSEEVHVVCLFPELSAAMEFSDYVYSRLPNIKNRPDIFGNQHYSAADGQTIRIEEKLLISASTIGIYEVAKLVKQYSGAAYPAHIDREANSLLNNLGLWDSSMGFGLAELSLKCPEDFPSGRKDLKGVKYIKGSDAHRIEQIPERPYQFMQLESLSAAAVIDWINDKNIIRS